MNSSEIENTTENPFTMNVNALQQRVEEIREDMKSMRSDMSDIAKALTRLAVLEERYQQSALVADRAAQRSERLEAELHQYRMEQVTFTAKAEAMARGIKILWAVLGTTIIGLGGKLLLLAMGMR